jgi:hypothetical protein
MKSVRNFIQKAYGIFGVWAMVDDTNSIQFNSIHFWF